MRTLGQALFGAPPPVEWQKGHLGKVKEQALELLSSRFPAHQWSLFIALSGVEYSLRATRLGQSAGISLGTSHDQMTPEHIAHHGQGLVSSIEQVLSPIIDAIAAGEPLRPTLDANRKRD